MSSPVRRIIIADDHQAIRHGVRGLLESRAHWQVIGEAGDGHEAVRIAKATQPDVAIIDYSLPLLNGLEVTRGIRRESPRTEVLIYTMHEREDLIVEVLRAGARGYVLKSDTGSHLIAAVEALAVRKPYFSSEISETLLEHFVEDRHATGNSSILTAREREIVQLIAEGNINKRIAHLLDISVKTVETHRATAMHKLKLRTTADLVRYAVRNNIVEP